MKRACIPYSAIELAWLKERATTKRTELHAEFCATFRREDVSFENLRALMKRKGWNTGRTGCFEKGQHSWNKGKSLPVSDAFKARQFKKGHRPHNQNEIGHERINREGYVEISVAERNPWTDAERRYIAKHKWLWEKAHGPVPDGHCLKCVDGDKTNTAPSNWTPIPRALLPRLNGRWGNLSYDDAEPELKPYVLAAAKLQNAARNAQKNHSQNGRKK
ncbi:HNH endonuclease [Roseobacter sp. TSBP12]|uniref:HNH endonuclease n=1 Tax=Roseobacter sp. TSBP12 TaxID=1236613 RepID=UPI00125F09DB|nr:HNH endonuclease [Roseobacter sp. TSBP12]KAB6715838.1 HNH endonuclease [Roseobacter sp. TSBP12]